MQIQNHTQIPNIIIDKMNQFTGEEIKTFVAICRKTIGWHKTTDKISYSQLVKMTGLSINGLKKCLRTLIDRKIITQERTKFGFKYDIRYIVSPHDIASNDTPISSNDSTIASGDTNLYHPVTPQKKKDTNKKETNIKDIHKRIFSYWNNFNIIQHKKLTDNMIKALNKKLKECSPETIIKIMDRYNQVIKDKEYYFDMKWSLENFLNREKGFNYFKDDGERWVNYLTWKNKNTGISPEEKAKRKRDIEIKAQGKRDAEFKNKSNEIENEQLPQDHVKNLINKISENKRMV